MTKKTAFVTNVKEYAGMPAAQAMAAAGWDVFCHDDSFASPEERQRYEKDHPGQTAAAARDARAFIAEGLDRFGRIDAIVSNDIPKGIRKPFLPKDLKRGSDETDGLEDFEAYLESLATEPVRLLRAALPTMKAAKSGSIVLITSGAPIRNPSMGGPLGYTAGRAAVHGLVRALASDLAPWQIQVNAVAPLLVYSPFFPSEIGPDDPQYAPLVKELVPMGRFGLPQEIGAVIAMLAGGDARFVSGQVIAFSGAGC